MYVPSLKSTKSKNFHFLKEKSLPTWDISGYDYIRKLILAESRWQWKCCKWCSFTAKCSSFITFTLDFGFKYIYLAWQQEEIFLGQNSTCEILSQPKEIFP